MREESARTTAGRLDRHFQRRVHWRTLSIVVASCLLVSLLASFAVLLVQRSKDAERDLTRRFATRSTLTSGFVKSYINDFAERERREAARLLSAPMVRAESFALVAGSLNLDAGAVLDSQGRLLEVWPPKPELTGTNMAERYTHLAVAVGGRVGVSGVVLSAVERVPVVAVAIPFETPAGRRVLSGAFVAEGTPLGSYLQSVVPLKGGRSFLLDAAGTSVGGLHNRQSRASDLTIRAVAGLHRRTGEMTYRGVSYTYAVSKVHGAPWHVVLAAPSSVLFQPVQRTPWGPWLLFLSFAVAGVVALVLLARLGRARAEAAQLARVDLLTGLPNRRAVDEAFGRLAAHALRNEKRLAVLSIDLDHFKSVNDTFGHRVGDQALAATGAALAGAVRAEDIVGRWGGEEFLVVLADATTDGTIRAGERLRAAITRAAAEAGVPIAITASVGAALDHPVDLAALLRAADDALYAAKDAGRNCLHLADHASGIPNSPPTFSTH